MITVRKAFFSILLLLVVLPSEALETGISNATVTPLPSGCSLLAVSLTGAGELGLNNVFVRYDDGTGITKVYFVREGDVYAGELCPGSDVNATISVETSYWGMVFFANATVAVPSSVKAAEGAGKEKTSQEEPQIKRINAESEDVIAIIAYLLIFVAISSMIVFRKNVIYLGKCAVRFVRRALRK